MSTTVPVSVTCPLRGACDAVKTHYTKFVDWTSTHSVDLNKRLGAADTDCLVKKVAKVFFTLLAAIVLIPVSAAMQAGKWVAAKVKPAATAPAQPAAPPVEAPKAEETATA